MSEHRRHDVGIVHLASGDRHGPAEFDELCADRRTVFKDLEQVGKTRNVGQGVGHREGLAVSSRPRHYRKVFS